MILNHGASRHARRAGRESQSLCLYAAREPVFPKAVGGFFRRLKWWLMGFTLAIYYITP